MSRISIKQAIRPIALVIFCAGLLASGLAARTGSSSSLVPHVQAQEASDAQTQGSDERENTHRCTERNIRGRFGYSFTGTIIGIAPAPVPTAAVGVIRINGDGTLSATDTQSLGGQITAERKFTGTYTVNPNCTGSAIFSTGGTGNFVVVNDRTEFLFVFTNPGVVVSGVGKKQ